MATKIERLTEDEIAERTQETTRADGYRSTYANNLGVSISPWDFKLTFGVIIEATKQLLRLEERQEIYMSPQHLKAMVSMLSDKINEYEAAFGPITDPQAAVANPKRHRKTS